MKHKIADLWENDPYIVLSHPNPDIPAYVVQKESGEGRERKLHRHLLLPIGFLSDDPVHLDTPTPAPRVPRKTIVHTVPDEES